MASKQAQVAGSFPNLSLRLHIGQFDVGLEGITARAVALKLHLLHLPEAKHSISRRDPWAGFRLVAKARCQMADESQDHDSIPNGFPSDSTAPQPRTVESYAHLSEMLCRMAPGWRGGTSRQGRPAERGT